MRETEREDGRDPHLPEDLPTDLLRQTALAGDVVEEVKSGRSLHHDVETVPRLVPVLDGDHPGDVPDLLEDDDLQCKMVTTITLVCSDPPPEEHHHS